MTGPGDLLAWLAAVLLGERAERAVVSYELGRQMGLTRRQAARAAWRVG